MRLKVKVVPGSSRDAIVGWLGEALKVKVAAPPEKGRANEAVIALLADKLGLDPAQIRLISGHTSAAKVLELDGLDEARLRVLLGKR